MPTPTGVGCRGEGILEGITPSWTEIAVTLMVLAYMTICWLREPRRARREQGVQVSNSGRTLGVQTQSDTRNQGTQTEADVFTMRRCKRNQVK